MAKKSADKTSEELAAAILLNQANAPARSTSDAEVEPKARRANRTIVLVDEIEDPLVRLTAERLAELAAQSGEPVIVRICSRGGSINGGWAMHDLLASADVDIVTQGFGIVGSGAALAFLGGRRRLLAPNARFMVHEMRWNGAEGVIKLSEMRELLANMEAMQRKIDRLFARVTGLTHQEVAAWSDKDTYFSAQQAVKIGLADGLLRLKSRPKYG